MSYKKVSSYKFVCDHCKEKEYTDGTALLDGWLEIQYPKNVFQHFCCYNCVRGWLNVKR